MVAGAPPIESVLPAFLEFARGLRAGRPQRAVRRRLPASRLRARTGSPWPAFEVARHRPAGPPGAHPRRGAQLQARPRWPRLFRATTTPNHRALADARATVDVLHGLIERLGGLGRAHPRGAAHLHRAGLAGAAPQAPPRRGPARTRPGVYLFRDERAGSLYVGTSTRPAHPGALLLHRLRDRAPGWARWSGSPSASTGIVCATPLEAEVRELRLIAEHKPRYNRRSRFPERVALAQAHRRAVPAAVARARACATTAPTTSARSRRARPAEKCRGRAPRGVPAAAVHAAGCRRAADRRAVRAGRDGPLRRAVRRQRRAVDDYAAARRRGCATPSRADADDVVEAAQRADGRARRRRALRGGRRSTATGSPRSCARPPAPSGSTALDRGRRARRRPPRRPTGGWERRTSSATAGWPRPASIAAGRRRPAATSTRCVATGGDGRAGGPGPLRPRPPRRPSAILRWLEQPGRPAGRASTASGPARSRGASAAPAPLHDAGRTSRDSTLGARSTTGATWRPVARPVRRAGRSPT